MSMHRSGASHEHLARHCVKQEAGSVSSNPAGLMLRCWGLRRSQSAARKQLPTRKTGGGGSETPEALNINRTVQRRNDTTFQGERLAAREGMSSAVCFPLGLCCSPVPRPHVARGAKGEHACGSVGRGGRGGCVCAGEFL